MCVRWQNGVLLLAARARSRWPRAGAALRARRAAWLRTRWRWPWARSLGAFPQMAGLEGRSTASGSCSYPPHGADFLRLGPPVRAGDAVLVAPRPALVDARPLARLPRASLPLRRGRRWRSPLLPPLAGDDVREHVLAATGGRAARSRTAASTACCRCSPSASRPAIEWLRRLRSRRGRALVRSPSPCRSCVWNVALAERLRLDWSPPTTPWPFRRWRGSAAQLVSRPRSASRPPGPRAGSSPARTACRRASTICSWAATSSTARTTSAAASRSAPRETRRCSAEGWGAIEDHDGAEARRIEGRARALRPPRRARGPRAAVRVRAPEPRRLRVLVNGRAAGALTAGQRLGRTARCCPGVVLAARAQRHRLRTDEPRCLRRCRRVSCGRARSPRRWA